MTSTNRILHQGRKCVYASTCFFMMVVLFCCQEAFLVVLVGCSQNKSDYAELSTSTMSSSSEARSIRTEIVSRENSLYTTNVMMSQITMTTKDNQMVTTIALPTESSFSLSNNGGRTSRGILPPTGFCNWYPYGSSSGGIETNDTDMYTKIVATGQGKYGDDKWDQTETFSDYRVRISFKDKLIPGEVYNVTLSCCTYSSCDLFEILTVTEAFGPRHIGSCKVVAVNTSWAEFVWTSRRGVVQELTVALTLTNNNTVKQRNVTTKTPVVYTTNGTFGLHSLSSGARYMLSAFEGHHMYFTTVPQSPMKLKFDQQTYKSVRLYWAQPDYADNFTISYTTDENTYTFSSDNNSIYLDNLSHDIEYNVSVIAQTEQHISNAVNIIINLVPTAEKKPTNIRLNSITPTLVHMDFDPHEEPYEHISAYIIEYGGRRANGDVCSDDKMWLPPAHSRPINITVKGGCIYNFTIKAYFGPTNEGELAWKIVNTMVGVLKPSEQVPRYPDYLTHHSFAIWFDPKLFDDENGPVETFAVIVAEASANGKELTPGGNLPGWRKAISQNPIPPYQAFHEVSVSTYQGEKEISKRSVADPPPVIIGGEDCGDDSPDYCNGHLTSGKSYVYWLRGFNTAGVFDSRVSSPFVLPKNQSTLIIGCLIILMILFLIVIILVGLLLRKRLQNREQSLNDDSSIAMESMHRDGGSLSRYSTTNRSLPSIPVRPDLPTIPSEANIPDISNESEHYYITKDQGPTPSRMFTEKDILLLLNLKLDLLQSRWMGTIEANKGTKKCVVLTTFTDKVLQRKDIHWDEFVKRTLDLPSARYLVNNEGFGIIKGNVFRQEQLKDTVYLSEVMSLIAGILEGLNLIHSYGFLHPGLSSKKILLVDKGLCKIYDFCLSKDASNMTSFRKSKMPHSLNHFPPETLHRNEYSRPSDVWSAAGVIWEILTGTLPFSCPQNGTTFKNQTDAPPESQIILYEQLKNKLLYQCWHLVCPRRPTIRVLRESYQVIFESLRDDTYEIPRIDLYTSMTTNTQDGKEEIETEVYTDTYATVS